MTDAARNADRNENSTPISTQWVALRNDESWISGNAVVGGCSLDYSADMQAKIEKIGEEFAVLLPKELVEACGFGTEATVTVQNKTLVVTPGPRRAREGWAEALRAISQEELDRDFAELQAFRETPDEWDAIEWRWPDASANEKV